jgi:hypothetical protein
MGIAYTVAWRNGAPITGDRVMSNFQGKYKVINFQWGYIIASFDTLKAWCGNVARMANSSRWSIRNRSRMTMANISKGSVNGSLIAGR